MTNFVLVGGMWLGSWAWRKVTPLLQQQGQNKVYPMTLTGLAERVHLGRPETDLNTHIEDVVNLLEFEDLRNVVLVGHSYSGIVVSGVAHRLPERISYLVYVDGIVPVHDHSVFGSNPPEFREVMEQTARQYGEGWRVPFPNLEVMTNFVSLDGLSEADLKWMKAKAVSHPINTLSQAVNLQNPAAGAVKRVYIRCTKADGPLSAEAPFVKEIRESQDWLYRELPSCHWPMISMPQELSQILLELVH